MSKNMTRKVLAVAAGAGLALSSLVSVPAQASSGLIFSEYGPKGDFSTINSATFTIRSAQIVAGLDASAEITVNQVLGAGQGAVDLSAASLATIAATELDVTNDPVFELELDTADTDYDADETYIYEVSVAYADGQVSETETVTFKPATAVSATGTLSAVIVADVAATVTIGLAGINTANYLVSNADDIDVTLAQTGAAAQVEGVLAQTWTYSATTDTYSQDFIVAAVAAEDVITVTAAMENSGEEVNVTFDEDADAFELERTVSEAAAYDGLNISVAPSTGVVHNSTDTATSLVAEETVLALEGTKRLNFVITAYETIADLDAAGSGHEITVTLTDVDNNLDSTTITAGGKTLSKDTAGNSVSFSLTTNSSGQVAFSVVADEAADGEYFNIDAIGTLGEEIDTTTVQWAEAAWTLVPAIDGDFTIAPKGSVAVDYTVIDQFGTLAGTDHQIAFTRAAGSGDRDTTAEYANWSYVAPVSATGRASVTIVDNGAAATEGSDTVTATLQKAATAGGAYLAVDGSTDTFVLNYENDLSALTSTAKVNYNGIADAAGTAVAPIYLETDPLVNYDSRLSTSKTAVNKWSEFNYDDDGVVVAGTNSADSQLRVYGTVTTTNGAPVAGVAVKLSGAGLNFADEAAVADMTRASNDSIVVFTDATGSYEAFVRGATTGNVTIAVDAQGATSSVEVRFENSTGVATGLTLVGPTSVASGARADFVATVVDKFGKPVSGVEVTFKDNGPGVLNTTAAVETDAFGEAQATLTTLAAENGVTVVTAYATIAGVIVTKTVSITVGQVIEFIEPKVNVGSFGGKLVIYAQGLDGKTISWKVGGKWGTAVAVGDKLNKFYRPVAKKGVDVSVEIYVDGVLELAKTVTTK